MVRFNKIVLGLLLAGSIGATAFDAGPTQTERRTKKGKKDSKAKDSKSKSKAGKPQAKPASEKIAAMAIPVNGVKLSSDVIDPAVLSVS